MIRRFWALLLLGLVGACTTHAPAALAVDTPLLPYQAPDLTELTGEDEEPEDATEQEPQGAATNEPMPAAPAKAGK